MKIFLLVILNFLGLGVAALNIWGIVEAVQLIGGVAEAVALPMAYLRQLISSILGVLFTLVITFLLNFVVARIRLNTKEVRENNRR